MHRHIPGQPPLPTMSKPTLPATLPATSPAPTPAAAPASPKAPTVSDLAAQMMMAQRSGGGSANTRVSAGLGGVGAGKNVRFFEEDDVEVVGSRSRVERDSELQKSAVDLVAPPTKRVKSESSYALLVADFPPRSDQWCVESDTWSVAVIVELGQEDAMVAALSLEPDGNSELLVRKCLSNLRA